MSSQPTFRLSFIRRHIITLCQSRALRAALLAALNGGPDAGLVVEMVERVRPPARLPTQIVAPMSQGRRLVRVVKRRLVKVVKRRLVRVVGKIPVKKKLVGKKETPQDRVHPGRDPHPREQETQ